MTASQQPLNDLDRRWTEAEVNGDMAVTIGRWAQEAEFRDRPVNGEFRVTRLAVRDGSGWRLAGLHLSPIAGPPPAAAPPAR